MVPKTFVPVVPCQHVVTEPRYGELALALIGGWVCWEKQVAPGFERSREGSPVFPPVLVLIVRDGVGCKAPSTSLRDVPLI